MRLLDGDIIAGLCFPVLGECFIEFLIKLSRGVVGNVQQLDVCRQDERAYGGE